jgi:hypothetical protein
MTVKRTRASTAADQQTRSDAHESAPRTREATTKIMHEPCDESESRRLASQCAHKPSLLIHDSNMTQAEQP